MHRRRRFWFRAVRMLDAGCRIGGRRWREIWSSVLGYRRSSWLYEPSLVLTERESHNLGQRDGAPGVSWLLDGELLKGGVADLDLLARKEGLISLPWPRRDECKEQSCKMWQRRKEGRRKERARAYVCLPVRTKEPKHKSQDGCKAEQIEMLLVEHIGKRYLTT
jgi:hypothetical protein